MENSADGKTVQAAKEEICNTAINLIWQCQNSNLQDKDALKKLQRYVSDYLRDYLKVNNMGKKKTSGNHGMLYACSVCALEKCVIKVENKLC